MLTLNITLCPFYGSPQSNFFFKHLNPIRLLCLLYDRDNNCLIGGNLLREDQICGNCMTETITVK